MTPQQYVYCSQGYFLRSDRRQEGLRRIWTLLYNVHSSKGKGIKSINQLREYWPLSTDDTEAPMLSREEIKRRFARAVEQSKKRNERLKNGNTAAGDRNII